MAGKSAKGSKAKPKSKSKPARKAKTPREPVLNESNRRIVRIVLGVLCGILTVYTLVALLSIVIGAILLSVMLPMAGVLSSM